EVQRSASGMRSKSRFMPAIESFATPLRPTALSARFFFFKQKTAYEIGLGIPADRSSDLLLVRLVVLLPFQLLRLSLATPSRWTPLALSVFLHCVVALLLTLL